MDPLRFRCTGCGNCCRRLRVAVTALDVQRLVRATGRPAEQLVNWLAPDAVDMTGEPQGFVMLSMGRRLLVLAQANGACTLLGSGDRCVAYSARPRDCQAYPFELEPRSAKGDQRRLALLPLEGCDHADDGEQDRSSIERVDDARFDELAAYHALVARWNRLAQHRRRLGQRVGSGSAFLQFALATFPDAS